jgi:hypothetical protein
MNPPDREPNSHRCVASKRIDDLLGNDALPTSPLFGSGRPASLLPAVSAQYGIRESP